MPTLFDFIRLHDTPHLFHQRMPSLWISRWNSGLDHRLGHKRTVGSMEAADKPIGTYSRRVRGGLDDDQGPRSCVLT